VRSARAPAPDSRRGHELFAHPFPGQYNPSHQAGCRGKAGSYFSAVQRIKPTRINPSWRDSLDLVRRSATVRSQPGTRLWRLHTRSRHTRSILPDSAAVGAGAGQQVVGLRSLPHQPRVRRVVYACPSAKFSGQQICAPKSGWRTRDEIKGENATLVTRIPLWPLEIHLRNDR
jgi:hypothetical protein